MWITVEEDFITKINLENIETIEIKEDEILLCPPSRFDGDNRTLRISKANKGFEKLKEILANL